MPQSNEQSILHPDAEALLNARKAMRLLRPETPAQLHAYVRVVLGFAMPTTPLIAGHSSPFDYLKHSFFEDLNPHERDCIVWANRGGGKTQLAAIATLLDLIFKPGIQIRILGGSFEQSAKMYRYLKVMLADSGLFDDLLQSRFTGRYVELSNGSRVEVLAQSECAVRGQRVHKLRCDEVELFDRDIWHAAQLVTRSSFCGDVFVRGSIEALSTMHKPYGLMQELVRDAAQQKRRVFRWCALDVMQRCSPQRSCETCPIVIDCQGRAKHATQRGFMRIDDIVQQRQRISDPGWASEMLCERPSRDHCVYPEFDPAIHVFKGDDVPGASRGDLECIAGIDFGYRDPTVLLWAIVDEAGIIHVMDEFIQRGWTTEQFINAAEERSRGLRLRPAWVGADPAGHQRSEQSGVSAITLWKRSNWTIRTRSLKIEPGIEMVRRRLRAADGFVSLRVHRRCEQLIKAMTEYHYPDDRPDASLPVKDGPDHCCDALRYMVTNLESHHGRLKSRIYL